MVLNVNITSSALNDTPSAQRTSLRRVNVYVRPSGDTVQLFARRPTTCCRALTVVSPWYTTLSMSCSLAPSSKSGLSGPGVPTMASTTCPPDTGPMRAIGSPDSDWHAHSSKRAARAAPPERPRTTLLVGLEPDVRDGDDEKRAGQDPRGVEKLPLQAAPGPVASSQPAVAAADGSAQTGRLGRLQEDARHQQDGDHDLHDDQGVANAVHGTPEVYSPPPPRRGRGVPSLPGRRQAPVDRSPVHGVPPGRHVVRALVLVLEVVGVLPDVDAQDRDAAAADRVVLVGEALDRQLAAGEVGPAPAAAELADRRLAQRVLEAGEVAERVVDRVRDRAGRVVARVRGHDLPEDRVVQVAAAVVAHDGADVLGHRVQVAQQLLHGPVAELGVLLDRPVQIVHVRGVVPVVVDLHGLRVDVRLERVEGVGQRGQYKGHFANLRERRKVLSDCNETTGGPDSERPRWRPRPPSGPGTRRPAAPAADPRPARTAAGCRSGCSAPRCPGPRPRRGASRAPAANCRGPTPRPRARRAGRARCRRTSTAASAPPRPSGTRCAAGARAGARRTGDRGPRPPAPRPPAG